tara:strand:+ start:414 stop:1541 length:1128 start_codon:yes stop_codon:yes gene_type:complete
MKKKICFIVGTRPEIIKLGPVYNYFRARKHFITSSFFSGQHTEIGHDVIKHFKFKIQKKKAINNYNLDLNHKMDEICKNLSNYLKSNKINGIFVLGDTLTAMIAAITAFNLKIKIFYVESGLRTYDFLEPWPEEGYRRLISSISNFHFCPTFNNKKNLLAENIKSKNICISGNPAIDAIHEEIKKYNTIYGNKLISKIKTKGYTIKNKKIVLITIHRRENFGDRFLKICKTIKVLSKKYNNIDFVITVHPNPYVKKTLNKMLKKIQNIYLIKPLFYPEFIFLSSKAKIVMSDSGGMQEELPTLKKYLILLREKTERNETINLGYSFICGSNKNKILKKFKYLIHLNNENKKFKQNPFGDGNSSKKIYQFTLKKLS